MTFKTVLTPAIPIILLFSSCHLPDRPVSQQEALALAKKIEISVTNHNPVVLDNVFDTKRFTRRVLAAAHQTLNLSLAQGAKEGLEEAHWGKQILEAVQKDGGSYTLLRQYEKDNHQHLLFRMVGDHSGINYHDFLLIKTDEGIKAMDVYIYLTGEDLSKTVAQSIMLSLDKLPDMSTEDQQVYTRLKRINELIESGENDRAADYYNELPDDLKKQKTFQLIHVRLASKLGDSLYLLALNEYHSNFPQDPNLYLLMIDAYFLEKDYPGAMNAVNHLDSIVGKDPYQDYFRGLIYKQMKDTLQSRICLERLHRNLPGFAKGTVELLVNFATSGHPDSAALLVKEAVKDNYFTPDIIESVKTDYPNIKPYLK